MRGLPRLRLAGAFVRSLLFAAHLRSDMDRNDMALSNTSPATALHAAEHRAELSLAKPATIFDT
jgi:hypothetical protein